MIGIGEVSSTISLAKNSAEILSYFKKIGLQYFRKKSLPLDWFANRTVEIVCSSLFAPPKDGSRNCHSLVKLMPDESGNSRSVPIGGGFDVTGVHDAFALTKIAIALLKRKAIISLATDSIDEKLKKNDLCLLGGYSSNLVARDLYQNYIPRQYHFYAAEGGMNIHGKNFRGGNYGHVMFVNSPWNSSSKILWMAGLGPSGTGAAVDFVIQHFHDKAPAELRKLSEWILFLKGIVKNDRISDVVQIGHYIIS